MAQAGLGDTQPQPLTMSERYNIARSMRSQGATDDEILASIGGDYTVLPSSAQAGAGLGDDAVAEDDGAMGFGELLTNYGPRTAISGALEGLSGMAEDYIGDGTISDGLQKAADTVGPTPEQEAARAERAGEKGFVGTVGDAITQEAGTLAGTIAAGAAAGTAFGPGVGTVVGGVLGAGVGIARMYDQGRDNVVDGKVAAKLGIRVEDLHKNYTPDQIAKYREGIQLDADDKKRVAAVGALGAVDAFPAGKVLKMIRPQQVAGIATKHLGKAALKEGAKTGAQEGALEFAQELGTMLLTDADLQADIAKLPEKDILALGQHIAETKGEDLAVSFLAGFGLGKGAGGVGGAVQQSAANKYNEKRIKDTAALADSRGIDIAALEEISKDPKQVGQLQTGISEIQSLQESVNALQASYDDAEAEMKGAIAPELEDANARLEAKIDATYGEGGLNIPGFKPTASIKQEQKDVRERTLQGAATKLSKLNVKTPKAKDVPDTEVVALAEAVVELEQKAADRKAVAERLGNTSAKKKPKKQKEYQEALDAEADAAASFEAKYNGADPVEAKKAYLADVEKEGLDENKVAAREADEVAAEMTPEDQRYEQLIETYPTEKKLRKEANATIRRISKEGQDTAIKEQLKKKEKQLAAAEADFSTPPQEIAKLKSEVADLVAKKDTPHPAVVLARRVLQDLDGGFDPAEGKLPSRGETEGQTPSGTSAETTAAEAQAGQAPTVEASAAERGPLVEKIAGLDQEIAGLEEQLKTAEGPAKPSIRGKLKTRRKNRDVAAEQLAAIAEPDVDGMPASQREAIRQGYDDPESGAKWADRTDDIDLAAGMEAHEDTMRELMDAGENVEFSASYDADGNVLGFGTNNLEHGVGWPTQDWNEAVSYTHSHPMPTPFSLQDIDILRRKPKMEVVRAVVKGRNTIEVRPTPKLKAMSEEEFVAFYDNHVEPHILSAISDGEFPIGADTDTMARIQQEAQLELMAQAGLIEYTQKLDIPSKSDKEAVNAIYDKGADSARNFVNGRQGPARDSQRARAQRKNGRAATQDQQGDTGREALSDQEVESLAAGITDRLDYTRRDAERAILQIKEELERRKRALNSIPVDQRKTFFGRDTPVVKNAREAVSFTEDVLRAAQDRLATMPSDKRPSSPAPAPAPAPAPVDPDAGLGPREVIPIAYDGPDEAGFYRRTYELPVMEIAQLRELAMDGDVDAAAEIAERKALRDEAAAPAPAPMPPGPPPIAMDHGLMSDAELQQLAKGGDRIAQAYLQSREMLNARREAKFLQEREGTAMEHRRFTPDTFDEGLGIAGGLNLARTADQDPLPGQPADPQRVADLTKPFVDKVMSGEKTPAGKIKTQGLTHLEKAIATGELTQAGMNAGLNYAANAVSTEGTEASTVVLQAARLMFPKAKMTPTNFVKKKITRKNGKQVVQLNLSEDWKFRMNAAYQFLNRVGQEEGMGFEKIKLPLKQKNGFWDFDATHFTMSPEMDAYLQMSPPESALFTRPMEDPNDTTDIIRNVDSNVFTPEAIDRMRKTAEYMQANTYYLDQEAIAALKPDDLISDKKLGEQLLKRNDAGQFVDKDGTPVDDLPQQQARDGTMTDHPAKKFIKTQRYRQTKKLAMLKRMAAIHGDQPMGYRYRVDDKGRIYADGAFTPQTGDYVKGILRVGEPGGPKLKDMPMVDHSASGWQVATLMTKDKEAANWFNLGSRKGEQALALQENYKKRDMYDTLMNDLKAEIIADANNSADPKKQKLAQLFKERVFDTNQPFGKVQIKPAVIAVNYAGGRANFQERLMEVYGDMFKDVPAADRAGLWGYTSAAAYNQLRAKAPDTMKFQDWAIDKLASLIAQVEGNSNALKSKPKLNFSVGLDGSYAKIKPVSKDVKIKATDSSASSVEQTVDVPTEAIDANATARSIYSQIIQGFDASILHRAMDIYKQNGDDYVTSNHDSYTTPQGQAGRMAAAAREAMKQIMTEVGDAPGRLRAEIEAQAAEYGAEIEGLNDPEVFNADGSFRAGDYDLNDLDTAVPVFVENAADVAPALTDLQGNVLPEAPAFEAIARGINFDASDTGAETGVAMDTSLPKAAQYAQDNQFPTGRDFKVQLQEQALASQAREGIDLTKDTPENIERLADFVFEDARAAAVNNSNAIGWYGRTVDAAKAELRKLHPELTPGSDAEFQFSWALAVTSNGLKVDKNFQLAEQAYNTFKKTGAFPTDIGVGQAAQQINSGLQFYQQLVDKLGSVQAAKDFMVKRQPVRDIERISGISVSKEGKGTTLPGAVILGPKIGGGFFSNLYGNFNELTMDRWFTRTVQRWRGGLLKADPVNIKKKQGEMKAALKTADLKALRPLFKGFPIRKTMTNAGLDALAMEVAKRSQEPAWRSQINSIQGGEAIRKVGNMHAKYLDGQVEDPGGAKARTYLRDVFNRGLDRLRAEPDMNELTMADLQALLWYPEKRLYDTAKKPAGEEVTGYENDEAPDYATAAAKLVRDRLGQAGRDGAGPQSSGAGAEPSFGPALASGRNVASDTRAVDADGSQAGEPRGVDEYVNNDVAGVGTGELSPDVQQVDAASYAEAMDAAIPFMGDFAAQVSRVPDDPDIQRFTLDDGYSGFALDGDNIIGVFSSPGAGYSGAAGRILQAAVAAGGRRLDGFDTFLPKVYADNGFRAVARLPFNREYAPSVDDGAAGNWNYETMAPFNNGEPDVVFMVYDPANASPDTDQVIGDYQDGIDIQDTEIEGTDAGATAGGAGQPRSRLQQDDAGATGAGAPEGLARGINDWLGAKPDTNDARIKSEIEYAKNSGRTTPNAVLAHIRHSPLFNYDVLMNDATKRDGKDYGPEFFKANSKFTKGLGAKLAQLSRNVPTDEVPFYLDMVKAQKNDHISKLVDGINRGTIQVGDIDPVTKTYRTEPAVTQRQPIERLAMGRDVTAQVRSAPKKAGIAQPVEYKTPERVAQSLFQGAADPGGTFDKIQQWLGRVGRSSVRNVFDRQAALSQIESLAGMAGAGVHDGMAKMAQMMTASTGRVAAMMSFGAPKWNPETKLFEIDRDTKGLEKIFDFNDVADYQNFQGWAYAKRDRDLMKQGKGARMTDELRSEYENISDADKTRYNDMLAEYQKFNNGLRKLMLDSGLISKEQMDALAKENEYVPMFRQFDDPEQFGLQNVFYGQDGGFSHPDPNIKSMKSDAKKVGEIGGGEFGDLIEGIHNNAVAVMHAASQNLAHGQIYQFMQDNMSHEASKVKPYTLRKKEKKAARGGGDVDAVKFFKDGKEVYWKPKGDPEWTSALHMALAGLRPAQLDGIDKALKSFNGYMRQMVTSTPAFAIRSVIRDAGQAYVQSDTNPLGIAKRNVTMLAESWQGYSRETENLMMSSGVGGYQMQGMPKVDAANLRKKINAQESGRMHQIKQAFGAYERVLGGTELAARSEVYSGIKKRPGQTEADAAYEALNMIDYNRKGASRVVQRLSYMVLFLNPRLQGMYRLFNETSGDDNSKFWKTSASIFARGAVLTGLGLGIRALTAMDDEDEERYRALSVSDRATYFHIPIPGTDRFLRLPKPFEVGAAFATLPVAAFDAVAMGEEGMNDAGMMAAHVFSETFSLNPTPQAVKPIVEVMLNHNMFSGREIEGMRLEGLPKHLRADLQTGGLARVLGNKKISPVQIQHLLNGYLGPLGMFGYNAVDATMAGAGLVPDKAAKAEGVFGGFPGLARVPADFTAGWLFSKTDAERGTRHVGNFYDLHSQITQYTAAINEASRMGDVDEVRRLQTKSAQIMPLKKYMSKVSRNLSKLNQALRVAQLAPGLTDAERQEKIAKINIAKNDLVRGAMEVARKQGVAGSFLGGAIVGDTVGV